MKRYGVKQQTNAPDDVARAVEQLRLVGYTCVDAGYDAATRARIEEAFVRSRTAQEAKFGGADGLRALNEHNTIRAPFSYDAAFLELAQNPKVLRIVADLIGGPHTTGTFVLNQQNGIINPAGEDYNQAAYHRDLPYQHFWSSRPLAINALYCIDAFTAENGATLVVPGTHKSEPFPSDETVQALAQQVEAPAGSFIVLDCMVYHSGAANRSASDRRAVNHVYTIPIIRQQIDAPALLGAQQDLGDDTRKLLGYDVPPAQSLEVYYAHRRSRISG